MRKLILTTLALAVLAMPAAAQTATGTVNASARINATLTVVAANPLNFGTAIAPVAATVSVPVGAAPGGTGQTLGSLQISHNTTFSVSTALPANLTHTSGATMAVSFTCAYAATATGAITGSSFPCSTVPTSAIGTYGTTQTTYLQVGGDLTVVNNQLPGTYTGSVVFTLTAITT